MRLQRADWLIHPETRMTNAIKKLILFVALAGVMPAAYATTIPVDLGPSARITGDKIVTFTGLNNLQLNGQTVSLDFVFSGDSFVRLFKETSTSFELALFLDLVGAGTINNPTGTGYIFDSANTPISSVAIFGGSVTTGPGGEAFRFGLADFFPLLADVNGTPRQGVIFPLDIYGAHLEITLPNAPAFQVTGGEFGLFAGNSQFQIGDVPDNGATLPLALGAFLLLLAFHAAKGRFGDSAVTALDRNLFNPEHISCG